MAPISAQAKINFFNNRRPPGSPVAALDGRGKVPVDFNERCCQLGPAFYNNLPKNSGDWRTAILQRVMINDAFREVNLWRAA
jgi:hypothetical protein